MHIFGEDRLGAAVSNAWTFSALRSKAGDFVAIRVEPWSNYASSLVGWGFFILKM